MGSSAFTSFINKRTELLNQCDLRKKPMTTDEFKCRRSGLAERKSGKAMIVTLNYRIFPHTPKSLWKCYEPAENRDIDSVDFHWYLDTSPRSKIIEDAWHRRRRTLLDHKSHTILTYSKLWIDLWSSGGFLLVNWNLYGKKRPIPRHYLQMIVHARIDLSNGTLRKSEHLMKIICGK